MRPASTFSIIQLSNSPVFIYNNSVVDKIEDDFQRTLAKSHKVTLMEVKNQTLFTKITGHLLRLFAPLM